MVKKKKVLTYSPKTRRYQRRIIKLSNLEEKYIQIKITKEDRAKQPKLLKRKRKAYIKLIQVVERRAFYRNMMVWNYVPKNVSSSYPLFMEIRITKIDTTPQDLRSINPTMEAIHNRILNLFASFRASIGKDVLKLDRDIQLTIMDAARRKHTKGKENVEISAGEINIDLNYYDKYVRIKTPQIGEREYTNDQLEKAFRSSTKIKYRVDQQGRVFIRK